MVYSQVSAGPLRSCTQVQCIRVNRARVFKCQQQTRLFVVFNVHGKVGKMKRKQTSLFTYFGKKTDRAAPEDGPGADEDGERELIMINEPPASGSDSNNNTSSSVNNATTASSEAPCMELEASVQPGSGGGPISEAELHGDSSEEDQGQDDDAGSPGQVESAAEEGEPQPGDSGGPAPAVLLDISDSKTDQLRQPKLSAFPIRSGRRFSVNMYQKHEWIEYSIKQDAVFCFACRHFAGVSTLRAGERLGQRVFIDTGYTGWRNMAKNLKDHHDSRRHKNAVLAWLEFRAVTDGRQTSIASRIDSNRRNEVRENRAHVKSLIEAASFLGRQGLPFRGHDEDDDAQNKGNFLELLDVMKNDKDMMSKDQRRYGHYSSPEAQNDMIKVIGEKIRDTIINEVKEALYFSILVDETKDLSKKEQLAIMVRYVHNGMIKERAIGTYHMKDLTAEALAQKIIGLLETSSLDIQLCVAQCYDGASVMRGNVRGVQALIRDRVPHVAYIHCHAHRLNLVLVNTLTDIPEMKEFFNIVQTLYTFIANSNTRHMLFVEAQKKLGQKVFHLERTCPTRWLYWYRSVEKIKSRYEAILAVLDATIDAHTDGSAEASGLRSHMETFSFVLRLHALERILSLTYGLSEQLQTKDLAITMASNFIRSTKSSLERLRGDSEWEATQKNARAFATALKLQCDTDAPRPTQVRVRPERARKVTRALVDFIVGSPTGQRETVGVGDPQKRLYIEILERFISEFNRRFTENDELLHAIQAFDCTSEHFLDMDRVEQFGEHYNQLIDTSILTSQCQTAKAFLEIDMKANEENSIMSVMEKLSKMPLAFSEVIKLFKIAATIPVSTASNERFFSVLKRVKTYLRTTMGDDRLCNLMLMAVEATTVKSLDPDELVNAFARLRPRRYPLMD